MMWAPLDGIAVRVIKGQTEPVVQGWMPLCHGRRGVRPIPTVSLEVKRRGRFHIACVFAEGDSGVKGLRWGKTGEVWDEPALIVSFANGAVDSVRWSLSAAPGWKQGEWARSKSLTVVRRRPEGRLRVLP